MLSTGVRIELVGLNATRQTTGWPVEMPPAIWIQGRPDAVHDYRDPESPVDMNEPERFAHNYRAAGGEIEVLYVDQAVRSTDVSFDPLAAFFRKHLS